MTIDSTSTAANNRFHQTVESGDVKTVVCGKDKGFNYDALTTLGGDKIKATFSCRCHKIVLDMNSSNRAIWLNGHKINLPTIEPVDGLAPTARFTLVYEVQDDGTLQVDTKLHLQKKGSDEVEVQKYEQLKLASGESDEINLTGLSSETKVKSPNALATKDYFLYKQIKDQSAEGGAASIHNADMIVGSQEPVPTQPVSTETASITAARDIKKEIGDITFGKLKKFDRQLNGLKREIEAGKSGAEADVAKLESAIQVAQQQLDELFTKADQLKKSAFDAFTDPSSSDVVNYCNLINILHNKANKIAEANAKIDEVYPRSDPDSAKMNQRLKMAIPLFSLGEKDNSTKAHWGDKSEFGKAIKSGEVKVGKGLNNHSAELLEKMNPAFEADSVEFYSALLKGEGDMGARGNFMNITASIDAPRPYRDTDYWDQGRLISKEDRGYKAFGQPTPVQAAIEVIRSSHYAKSGENARILEETLIDLLTAKIREGVVEYDDLIRDIKAIDREEYKGDLDDSKNEPIKLFDPWGNETLEINAGIEKLRDYLTSIAEKAAEKAAHAQDQFVKVEVQ